VSRGSQRRVGWVRRAGPIVSVLSLAAVAWWALHQQAPRWPTGATSQALLACAVIVYAGVTLIRGLRWYLILHRAGVPAGMADTQALIVVGYMGNAVLPARGGELLRIFFLGRRTGSSRVTILGTLVAERLLDVLALLGMLLALGVVTATSVRGVSDLGASTVIVLVALALVLLAAGRIAHTRLSSGLGRQLASLILPVRNLLSPQGALLTLLTAVIWVGEGFVYWLVGDALDLHLNLLQGCFLVVLSSLAAIVPAAPGYLGTYDAAIQVGLGAMGVRGGRAISFGLLVRLVIFVPITLAGLILIVARYGGLSSLRPSRRAGAATALHGPASSLLVPSADVPDGASRARSALEGATDGASLLRTPMASVGGGLARISK
jgi:glycosyltransferase 2 family protein